MEFQRKTFTDQKIQEIKNIAWDYFLSTGLPLHRRGNEEWKYTNLNPISEINFNLNRSKSDVNEINKFIPISSDWHNLIFIDGKISNQNLISNIEIKISKIDSIKLPDEFATLAKPDSSPFTALNTAFFSEGIVVGSEGIVGMGYSPKSSIEATHKAFAYLFENGGVYHDIGSAALMIAYVAAGRYLGCYEYQINSWDCLAGICMVRETGGWPNDFLAKAGLHSGNPVLAAAPGIKESMLNLFRAAGH